MTNKFDIGLKQAVFLKNELSEKRSKNSTLSCGTTNNYISKINYIFIKTPCYS